MEKRGYVVIEIDKYLQIPFTNLLYGELEKRGFEIKRTEEGLLCTKNGRMVTIMLLTVETEYNSSLSKER